jgi:D-inositol-3-phosphate glycosyltransferase
LPTSKLSKVRRIQSEIGLLTGGSDRPYVFGLTTALISKGPTLDLIGSDELEFPEFRNLPGLNFLNLRGSSRSDVSLRSKVLRILAYYLRLLHYAATATPEIFHILWNNKFETIDRTFLMLYYRLLGKKVVLTVHNVNSRKRDLSDGFLNRLTLRVQYGLAHHIFVHTEKMKRELNEEYAVSNNRVSVIPFGINNAVPHTSLTPAAAKKRLNLDAGHKVLLFFGRITPYKGLDWLIPVFRELVARQANYRLIIAGRPDNCKEYWTRLRLDIQKDVQLGTILLNDDFIPDEQVEVYFKAADALILPYRDIYQSGVLFLGQSFGLPVVAADVGSLKDEIVENKNGYTFEPENSEQFVEIVQRYFSSDLYRNLSRNRSEIRKDAVNRHSWEVVAQMTLKVYSDLAKLRSRTVAGQNAGSADAESN